LQRTRRQSVIRVFEIAGVSLVLLDVLLYFAISRPVGALVSSQQQQFTALRRRIFEAETRIEQLKKFQEALPKAGERLSEFERDHTPPRREGFSEAAKLVRRATDESGTHLVSVAYKLDSSASGPIQRLGLVINVEGPFPALLKFAHAVETASDFVVTRGFNIAQGDRDALTLRLAADLYLTP
jgi:hypothetical protein